VTEVKFRACAILGDTNRLCFNWEVVFAVQAIHHLRDRGLSHYSISVGFGNLKRHQMVCRPLPSSGVSTHFMGSSRSRECLCHAASRVQPQAPATSANVQRGDGVHGESDAVVGQPRCRGCRSGTPGPPLKTRTLRVRHQLCPE
jgi:hypothetical protein